eukprot:GEMP01048220.1.p1 GENE.GEMP01048220.1~~GEMP01048220.1.p1  ORF type:complete len:300 (+),score=55.20 GEMP01048220.1:41-940(+)
MKFFWAIGALAAVRTVPTRYLVVTVPSEGNVVAYRVGNFDDHLRQQTSADAKDVQVLITGLVSPIGVAYSAHASALYVADQGRQTIYKYPLSISPTGLQVGSAEKLLLHIDTRWLAVHGETLFFTDETANQIMRLKAGEQIPEVVYSAADSASHVSSPGGIFSDAYYLYWTNKNAIEKSKFVAKLATNVNKAYGVCGSDSAVYYTDESGSIYGVKKDGTAVIEMNSKLSKPRGCAFAEGTVFVADQASGVYSFAGNRSPLRPVRNVHLVKSIMGATGITVVSSSFSLCFTWILVLAVFF